MLGEQVLRRKGLIMKRTVAILIGIIIISITACGKTTATDFDIEASTENVVEASSESTNREYTYENMTREEFGAAIQDASDYSEPINMFFSGMSNLATKYKSEYNASNKFNWSKYDDFNELKAVTVKGCEEILELDRSYYPEEFQYILLYYQDLAQAELAYLDFASQEQLISKDVEWSGKMKAYSYNDTTYARRYLALAQVKYEKAHNGDTSKIKELESKNEIYEDKNGSPIFLTEEEIFAYKYLVAFSSTFKNPHTVELYRVYTLIDRDGLDVDYYVTYELSAENAMGGKVEMTVGNRSPVSVDETESTLDEKISLTALDIITNTTLSFSTQGTKAMEKGTEIDAEHVQIAYYKNL